ncbi:MAG: hypothetical protein GY947_24330 [Rhodobacteraceae bacterium]|nr:hypothetical protein [Paracoccaceae bacterium]
MGHWVVRIERKQLAWIRRSSLGCACLLALTACSIKDDVPDFKYPSRTNYEDQNWPQLAVTEELIKAGEVATTKAKEGQKKTEAIEARAHRLRARARALRVGDAN